MCLQKQDNVREACRVVLLHADTARGHLSCRPQWKHLRESQTSQSLVRQSRQDDKIEGETPLLMQWESLSFLMLSDIPLRLALIGDGADTLLQP